MVELSNRVQARTSPACPCATTSTFAGSPSSERLPARGLQGVAYLPTLIIASNKDAFRCTQKRTFSSRGSFARTRLRSPLNVFRHSSELDFLVAPNGVEGSTERCRLCIACCATVVARGVHDVFRVSATYFTGLQCLTGQSP